MTLQECEELVLREHAGHAGKILLVSRLTAYLGDTDDQGEFSFDPPIRVRVEPEADKTAITHQVDDWIDPYWDVEIVETNHPQLPKEGLRSAWIFGPSINVKTGEREPSTDWKLEDVSVKPAN